MNTLSNVIDNIIFAAFFTLVGALFASSLILWFYADERILSVMCFALFAVLCFITFKLAYFRFKSEITELIVTVSKLIFAISLSFLGCYLVQFTYELAITSSSPSYMILSFISVLFMFSQMLSVYINSIHSVNLISYLSDLYKSSAA